MSDKPIPTLREILHTVDGIKDRPLASRIEPEPRVDVEALWPETRAVIEAAAELSQATWDGGDLKKAGDCDRELRAALAAWLAKARELTTW